MKNKPSIIPNNNGYRLYAIGENSYGTYAEVIAKNDDEAIEIAADLLSSHYCEAGYNERKKDEDSETYIRRICRLSSNDSVISNKYTVGRINWHE